MRRPHKADKVQIFFCLEILFDFYLTRRRMTFFFFFLENRDKFTERATWTKGLGRNWVLSVTMTCGTESAVISRRNGCSVRNGCSKLTLSSHICCKIAIFLDISLDFYIFRVRNGFTVSASRQDKELKHCYIWDILLGKKKIFRHLQQLT